MNGSTCTTHEVWKFTREPNLELCTTVVSSPQSDGIAERFVKTMKEYYTAFMPKKPMCEQRYKTLLRRSIVTMEPPLKSALGYLWGQFGYRKLLYVKAKS